MSPSYLTDAQLRAELQRCQSCEAKPCRGGCPAGVSPADFILAARSGEPSDYRRAAAHILAHNPLGGVCGSVCPETLCMARCTRRDFDAPVNIPALQAAIVRKARALPVLPRPDPPPASGLRVAVVGAGPAGLGAASVLAQAGHTVHLFDRARRPGGMARLVPRWRLDPEVLDADVSGILALGDVRLSLGRPVALPRDLLGRGFAAVVVAPGLGEPMELDLPGARHALGWAGLLGPRPPALDGRRVAVVGDGGVAVDCARAARERGAAHVELFALKALSELAPTRQERDRLAQSGAHVTCRVRVTAIHGRGERVSRLALRKVELPPSEAFHPSRLVELPGGAHERRDLDTVVLAIGSRAGLRREPHPRIVYAGDLESGPTSVVEALASGRRAGLAAHQLVSGDAPASCPDRGTCPEGGGACPKRATCPEWNRPASAGDEPPARRVGAGLPVPLDCTVLGRPLRSPFLLASPPFTGSYAQVKRAYEAGWAGAVMSAGKGEGEAIERLRREFPDRLTLSWPEGPALGDPGDHLAAAEALARGAPAVAVDGLVRRHGLGILNELQSGLSWLLAEQGLSAVADLVRGTAHRPPASAEQTVAVLERSRCTACGNCTRCPEVAIALDARGTPVIDPARCTGCGLCVEQCLPEALTMAPA
jgi:NADPH-dependent glutamate synthase beta subunit-like oxidoreductase/Pyruvate/2-oxoacid:ferredoxin oxidoreductase delta subunit